MIEGDWQCVVMGEILDRVTSEGLSKERRRSQLSKELEFQGQRPEAGVSLITTP